MSTIIRAAVFAAAVLGGLSAATARYYDIDETGRTPSQYNLNNPDDARAFWDDQARRSGS